MRQEQLFATTLASLEAALRELEQAVPPPQPISYKDGHIVRYREKQIQQAVVVKVAQLVSGLNASLPLLVGGHIYELGILKRTLDECDEAILLLSCGVLYGRERVHDEYLNWFFYDYFEDPSFETKPGEVPRKKIRNYLLRAPISQDVPRDAGKAMRLLMQSFSGYVHGASIPLMELVSPKMKLEVRGMARTARQIEHGQELWSYFFRGTQSTAIACQALGRSDLFEALRDYTKRMQKTAPAGYYTA